MSVGSNFLYFLLVQFVMILLTLFNSNLCRSGKVMCKCFVCRNRVLKYIVV